LHDSDGNIGGLMTDGVSAGMAHPPTARAVERTSSLQRRSAASWSPELIALRACRQMVTGVYGRTTLGLADTDLAGPMASCCSTIVVELDGRFSDAYRTM